MASLTYTTLDVFTSTKYAGNPLAVVHLPSTTDLTQTQKQTIAREFNYSETVFLHVAPDQASTTDSTQYSKVPEWKLDIFTVEEELPFAGHPTIGSACYALRTLVPAASSSSSSEDEVVKGRFLIKAGVLELRYDRQTGEARAGIPHNVHIHNTHTLTISDVLAKQPALAAYLSQQSGNRGEVKVEVVSPVKGMNFGMIELPDLEALGKVSTTGTRMTASLDSEWDFGPLMLMFYVRMPVEDSAEDTIRLRTRMVEGGFEDPATGSASCGLAAFLSVTEKREGRTRFEMVQGVEMGRRSEIGVEISVRGGEVESVELIGKAVEVMEGRVFYE